MKFAVGHIDLKQSEEENWAEQHEKGKRTMHLHEIFAMGETLPLTYTAGSSDHTDL